MEYSDLLKKTKILLIDDDQFIRSSLEYYFKKKTLVFVTLESAEEALELLKHEPFDVIICDYKLPRMNGLDFFFHLYELRPEALRIFITAYANDQVAIRAGGIGIDDFIEKPFTTKDIEESLHRLLEVNAPLEHHGRIGLTDKC
jgi:DNA-binding NtrC family response regulator